MHQAIGHARRDIDRDGGSRGKAKDLFAKRFVVHDRLLCVFFISIPQILFVLLRIFGKGGAYGMTEQEVREALTRGGIENAALEATLLCETFSGEALATALARRLAQYPLQYILGKWWFYRECYEVSPACLVPRSDTELLVEEAIRRLPPSAHFLDLCTGSGCVAISTLANRPDLTACAVDLFEETLALAARNAARNGVADRITLERADVLLPPTVPTRFDAILSNPPYIPNAVVPTLQREVQYEPAAALCGGTDGLDFYRSILKNWQTVLKKDGFLLLEIGYDQANALRALAAQYGRSATVMRDLGGNDRVVLLQ